MNYSSQKNNLNIQILNERQNIFNLLRKKYYKTSREDIEDVVQSSLIKALKFYTPSKQVHIRTYLMKIATNHLIDYNRRCYKKLECFENDFTFCETIFKLDDFSETLCNQHYDKDFRNKLFFGLENNINIKTFILFALDEKDYQEIAIIQNITIACVRKRIQKARELLKEKYQHLINEE